MHSVACLVTSLWQPSMHSRLRGTESQSQIHFPDTRHRLIRHARYRATHVQIAIHIAVSVRNSTDPPFHRRNTRRPVTRYADHTLRSLNGSAESVVLREIAFVLPTIRHATRELRRHNRIAVN